MYPSVYQHHTTRIANSMFRRGLKKLINSKEIDENDMYKYDDMDMVSIYRNSENPFVQDMITRLDNRDLFKRIKVIRLENFKNPEKLYKTSQETLRKAEEEIAYDLIWIKII